MITYDSNGEYFAAKIVTFFIRWVGLMVCWPALKVFGVRDIGGYEAIGLMLVVDALLPTVLHVRVMKIKGE